MAHIVSYLRNCYAREYGEGSSSFVGVVGFSFCRRFLFFVFFPYVIDAAGAA